MTFKDWYRAADAVILGIAGIGIDDLADGPSYDAWFAEMTPEAYADELLAENGWANFVGEGEFA